MNIALPQKHKQSQQCDGPQWRKFEIQGQFFQCYTTTPSYSTRRVSASGRQVWVHFGRSICKPAFKAVLVASSCYMISVYRCAVPNSLVSCWLLYVSTCLLYSTLMLSIILQTHVIGGCFGWVFLIFHLNQSICKQSTLNSCGLSLANSQMKLSGLQYHNS